MINMNTMKPINLWLLCLLLLFMSDALGCDKGFFGSRCQFKCHCRDECDKTGACVGDSQCVKGWFGPLCQYYDFAVNKQVFWGGVMPVAINELTDGNDSTCIRDSNNGHYEIEIKLKEDYQFTWIRFNGIMDWKSMSLVFDSSFQGPVECTNKRVAIISTTTLDVRCDLTTKVNTVFISWYSNYILCSVHISGGRNLAIKERASQSTDFDKENTADMAVDGNTPIDVEDDTCTLTDIFDKNPRWDLEFRRPINIIWVQIYNTDFHYRFGLKGYTIEIFNNLSSVYRYQDTNPNVQRVYSIHKLLQGISRITIKTKQYKYLSLCEVQVYGDYICPNGSYGLDCDLHCNCAMKDEQCYVETGDCPSRCAPGYRVVGCSYDEKSEVEFVKSRSLVETLGISLASVILVVGLTTSDVSM